jgi:hypothetical protein
VAPFAVAGGGHAPGGAATHHQGGAGEAGDLTAVQRSVMDVFREFSDSEIGTTVAEVCKRVSLRARPSVAARVVSRCSSGAAAALLALRDRAGHQVPQRRRPPLLDRRRGSLPLHRLVSAVARLASRAKEKGAAPGPSTILSLLRPSSALSAVTRWACAGCRPSCRAWVRGAL